jgi:outer membrane biosynthesis protein TonB
VIATYRNFQLPWELSQDQDSAFRKLVKQFALAVLAFCIVMPFLPVPEPDPSQIEELPPRFAKLLLEKPVPPPPPPVVEKKVEPVKQPDKVVPVTKAKPEPVPQTPRPQARETAAKAGLLPFAEQLADLRDTSAVSNAMASQGLSQGAGKAARTERAVIAASAGKSSGGINTSSMSRNTGGGGLEGRGTTRVSSPVAGMGEQGPKVVKGGGAPSRSREEIELVFDKNKGSIFALYNRALRRDPTLQGKLVLQLTIAPSGAVTAVEIVSSELNDSEMELKLVQRVKMFRFQDKDVATVTTTKPIDFFPA